MTTAPDRKWVSFSANVLLFSAPWLRPDQDRIDLPLPDPKDHHEALRRPDASRWRAAMAKELKGLESTGTIEWVKASDLPKGRKPLGQADG